MLSKEFYVYTMASKKHGVIYIGVTENVKRRSFDHKNTRFDGFTKKYFVRRMVYFEIHSTAEEAAKREKQMKKWERQWKVDLIEKHNPDWKDISKSVTGGEYRVPAFAGTYS